MSNNTAKKGEIMHHDDVVIPVDSAFSQSAWIDKEAYQNIYRESIENPEQFWSEQAVQKLDWITPFTKVKDTSFAKDDVHVKWFEDGQLNVAANCIDRHLERRADQVAIIWEPDNPKQKEKKITYRQLHQQVCKLANVLKEHGVEKGDRVIIYMPMIVEAAYAMLACARIGAVHSVVFGGFSSDALYGRIEDCQAKYVITADEGVRGPKHIPLKVNVDAAVQNTSVQTVLVVQHTSGEVDFDETRDVWYHEAMANASDECSAEPMNAEDPLFVLYTSGSTGKPKGVLHSSAGYLLYASLTHQYVFDYKDGEIYWCTADIGWVTGHSYIVYGPLANGATTLMFEGVPNYPDWSRCWDIVDKHQVNIFYTAPTAIRAQMREGNAPVQRTSRESLRLLGTVGEPINPEAWNWYYQVVGDGRCPVVDTWWQTEPGFKSVAPGNGVIKCPPVSVCDHVSTTGQ
jgi:acetyl-CoA synthetase